jgi:(E)-4-hydroxy-3-methylbut-2-enyl-diphosphate synthase
VADDCLINDSIALGSLLTEGIGDSIQVVYIKEPTPALSPTQQVQLSFNILQAAGARSSKAEFIACPSCGRTLFDLQSTTERIKAKTGHLVGVKIAVMGCIVNGLGELADADFGYMGGAPDKVNLFVGKTCVEKGVPTEQAVDRLVEIIKQHGRWLEEEE